METVFRIPGKYLSFSWACKNYVNIFGAEILENDWVSRDRQITKTHAQNTRSNIEPNWAHVCRACSRRNPEIIHN